MNHMENKLKHLLTGKVEVGESSLFCLRIGCLVTWLLGCLVAKHSLRMVISSLVLLLICTFT